MVLVDRVVGQVFEEVFEVGLDGSLILFSAKPGEAFHTDERVKRIEARDQDVNTEVELEAVEK